MLKTYTSFLSGFWLLSLTACTIEPAITIDKNNLSLPVTWQTGEPLQQLNHDNWLGKLLPTELNQAIHQALINNYQFKQQALSIETAKQNAILSGAALWPSLNVNLNSSRRKNAVNQAYNNNHELNLNLRYEIDLWGKLSANEQQANLLVASQMANFEQAKQQLIVDVILAWFKVVENQHLLSLNEQRLNNTQENLTIIEANYFSGLNTALDVYLARTEVATEQARVANQTTNLTASIRKVESLLGQYPNGLTEIKHISLPIIDSPITPSLPSEIISNNKALEASWLNLLSKNAGLAYAHKQRFPALNLTASLGTSSSELSELVKTDIGWSLLASISQPLFDAGRLKANEEKARIETSSAEQQYLAKLNTTFAEIENNLSKQHNLTNVLNAQLLSVDNADLAADLAFEQYLKGLVNYVSVLSAQSRAFNAKSSLLQTQYQLIENRLNLYLALGGDFTSILINGNH